MGRLPAACASRERTGAAADWTRPRLDRAVPARCRCRGAVALPDRLHRRGRLDGVIQAPGGPEEDQTGFAHGGWVFPYFDDALDEPMGRLLGGSYELLLGRRTYEIFAAYWPHNGDQPIGETFNAVRKHVVTSSDRPLTWNNSQRLVGDPVEAIARLKASDGPDLLIQGSSMLYQALLPAGLVNQLTLITFPVMFGRGKRWYSGDQATACSWTLLERAHSPKGVHFASF